MVLGIRRSAKENSNGQLNSRKTRGCRFCTPRCSRVKHGPYLSARTWSFVYSVALHKPPYICIYTYPTFDAITCTTRKKSCVNHVWNFNLIRLSVVTIYMQHVACSVNAPLDRSAVVITMGSMTTANPQYRNQYFRKHAHTCSRPTHYLVHLHGTVR